MKRFLFALLPAIVLLGAALDAFAGSVVLRYGFKPGQHWICKRLTHTEFMVMGKNQTQRNKHTIEYTVSKGPKKGWVHLSARYINPPPKTEENQGELILYDLTFHADIHASGDIRNVSVAGADKPVADPTLDPAAQAAIIQGRQMMADAHKAAVFWFPELPEERLSPGEDFEYKQKQKMGGQMMAFSAQSRQEFTLEEVGQGLAYFELREKTAGKHATAGAQVETKSAGKGETIFDLQNGMWMELVIKRKMSVAGLPMGGSGGQDMQMKEKLEMQLR
jgi:hypothetical protein